MWITHIKLFQNIKNPRIIVLPPFKSVDNYVDNVDFIIFIMSINGGLCKPVPA